MLCEGVRRRGKGHQSPHRDLNPVPFKFYQWSRGHQYWVLLELSKIYLLKRSQARIGLVNPSAYLLMEGLNSYNSNGKLSVPLSLQHRK